jgi:hypothetical protein
MFQLLQSLICTWAVVVVFGLLNNRHVWYFGSTNQLLRNTSRRAYSSNNQGANERTVGLNLRDPEIFKQKPTNDLLLAYGILRACAFEPLVNMGPKILDGLEKVSLAGAF